MRNTNSNDASNDKVRLKGVVKAVLPGTEYLIEVELAGLKHQLKCYISGKIRKNYIRVEERDVVVVEISPKDNPDLGRIVYKADKFKQLPAYIEQTLAQM